MTRDERIRSILRLLRQRRTTPMTVLLEALEVSRATIKRDLEVLRDRFGVPVVWDRERRGYRLEVEADAAELPGLWFSATEVHALITADYFLERLQPGLLGPLVEPLRDRLQALAMDPDQTWTEVTRRIRVLPMFARAAKPETFPALASAVLERRRARIHHFRRASGEVIEREVSPQRLVHYRDNWYLDAWCHLRDGLRTFSVDAVRKAELMDEPCKTVDDEALDRILGSGYGIFSGADTETAVIRFSPERARWVSREVWHPDQVATEAADGSLTLELPFSDPRELAMDILRHGPHVEVLAPDSLRRAVREQLEETLSLYKGE